MFIVKNYISDSGNDPIEKTISELQEGDLQEEIIAAIVTLRVYGVAAKSQLLKIKKIRGKILELKVRNFRVLFAFMPKNEILLLHAFIKKRQKLDPADIVLAEKRLKKYL